ncbi:MAG: BON domain-containing protein [Candidatus Eisenbacteria bacterium]|nr:BON domain-containing protein [Candidatus Eisenbacteria bacterium]
METEFRGSAAAEIASLPAGHRVLAASASLILSLFFAAVSAWAQEGDPLITDTRISSAITGELLEDQAISGFTVDVTTRDGVVTLSGYVNNLLAKERAERIAETVKGVRAVVNTLKIQTAARDDAELHTDVVAALAMDPATESWEIDVEINDGVVTLNGEVESWDEKHLAGKVAKSVRGVEELQNMIDVVYEAARPDFEIENEVEQSLQWDALVDDALIRVEVADGVVTLSGTVGSLAERRRAISAAWVAGVSDVGAEDLEVAEWARDARFREDKYVVKDDAEVADAVQDALLFDPRTASFRIDVSVEDGVATLRGKVDNLKAKRTAARTTRNVVGVWRVDNELRVRGVRPDPDALERRVNNALVRDPFTSAYEIDVDAANGAVRLSGTVDSYFEKAQADDVAARVKGVQEVNNNLKVDDETEVLTYDPFVDYDWYVYDYPWYDYTPAYKTAKTDWAIQSDIEDEFFWSPFVDGDQVDVVVEDGVATLTGTVDTWGERASAAENAYEGGAVFVNNDLRVRYGPEYYQP